MKSWIACLVLCAWACSLQAQDTKSNRDFLKNDDFSVGGGLHSNGWNILVERGYIKDAYHRHFWQLEYTQLHHPMEYRQSQNPSFQLTDAPKAFVFGKQNSFLTLNAYLGKQRLLGNKGDKSGVLISLKYQAGVSLGFLKPYYLDLIYSVDSSGRFIDKIERYSDSNASRFLDPNSIYGGAGFWKGITQLTPLPGIAAKVSLNFDWATYDDFVKSVETGLMAQFYYKPVPIMVVKHNRMLFPELFVHFQFGKRW